MLLIKGYLWKIIICISGWFGIYICLITYTSCDETGIIAFDTLITWATIIPTIIVLLAMAHTREE